MYINYELIESLIKTPFDSVLTETKAIVEQVLALTLVYLVVCIVLYKIFTRMYKIFLYG